MIFFKNIFILTKFTLSFFVSLSGAFSYIIYAGNIDLNLYLSFLSIFLLALGVSALNQIQEVEWDSKMKRTAKRPLVTKSLSMTSAIFISAILIISSNILAYYLLEIKGIIIYLGVVITYNIFYTLSKRISIYAGVYGAILGVVPPYIGWIVAGGEIIDIRFIAFSVMYFIWQIPHFWLLLLKHHKDYEKGGFPTIVKEFGIISLEKITTIWLYFTLITGIFTILAFNIRSISSLIFIIIIHIYLVYSISNLFKKKNYLKVFIDINIYILAISVLLVLEALFNLP